MKIKVNVTPPVAPAIIPHIVDFEHVKKNKGVYQPLTETLKHLYLAQVGFGPDQVLAFSPTSCAPAIVELFTNQKFTVIEDINLSLNIKVG